MTESSRAGQRDERKLYLSSILRKAGLKANVYREIVDTSLLIYASYNEELEAAQQEVAAAALGHSVLQPQTKLKLNGRLVSIPIREEEVALAPEIAELRAQLSRLISCSPKDSEVRRYLNTAYTAVNNAEVEARHLDSEERDVS